MNRPARPPRLSVIVITCNEVRRLGTCLASVSFADEVVVVDSGSTDGTVELARQLGARVIVHADWQGFGVQKQRALDAATGDWVLSLDADEWLDDELAGAVRRVVEGAAATAPDAAACHVVARVSAFCGQWMRFGSWAPDPLVRLFRRGSARFSEDRVHERLIVDAAACRGAAAAPLPGRLLHNSMTNLHDALDKMNRYSSDRAADLRSRGRRGGVGTAFGHGVWAFVRSYLLRRGFLDGRLGLVLAALDAQASYYRYLKLWLGDGRAVAHELPPPRGASMTRGEGAAPSIAAVSARGQQAAAASGPLSADAADAMPLLPSVEEADLERRFGGLRRLHGEAAYRVLRAARVAVVGLGGVGSWAAEALARSGVAGLTLIDLDHVSESNINRQVQALGRTVGQSKGEALRERIADIHPGCTVTVIEEFVDADNWPALLRQPVDALIDACDQVRAKAVLAGWALAGGAPLVTVGAAGGKQRPQAVEVADLSAVTHDPLLAALRQRLRQRHGAPRGSAPIGVPCVYSREPVTAPDAACGVDGTLNCHGYGSTVTVTATFGMVAAALAIDSLLLLGRPAATLGGAAGHAVNGKL